jgi:hypothetical protein
MIPTAELASLPGVDDYHCQSNAILGWFFEPDIALFEWLLRWQLARDVKGDILEIGVSEGKSAALLGYGLRPGETLTASDLFQYPRYDNDIGRCLAAFRATYAKFHKGEPEVIVGPSNQLDLAKGRFRFVHVDGGHSYGDVVADLATVAYAAADDAILVMDDYCHPGYPGVAAATWVAVSRHELYPFVASPGKLYAARSAEIHAELLSTLGGGFDLPGWKAENETVLGTDVLCLTPVPRPSTALRRAVRSWVPPALLRPLKRRAPVRLAL